MRGFGGMLSFSLVGGYEAVKDFLPRLRFAHRAANLGAVETTVGPPATTSHVESSAEEREAMGIPEALVRYSAGIEHADDLISDLDGRYPPGDPPGPSENRGARANKGSAVTRAPTVGKPVGAGMTLSVRSESERIWEARCGSSRGAQTSAGSCIRRQ